MISNISLTRQKPASLRGQRVAARLADAMIVSACKPGQLWNASEPGHADERHDDNVALAGCGGM